LLPDGRAMLKAAQPRGTIDDFIGLLAGNEKASHDRGNQRACCRRLGRQEMNISVDTNVLVRAVLQDDAKQARTANKLLREASLIAVSMPYLCELS